MSQKAIRRTITAAFFAATLALTGTSEAGGLFTTPASETRIEQNLWAQAWDWMSSVWGDLLGTSSDKDSGTAISGTPTGSTTTSTTTTCTNPAGCEAGWGIDPNG